MKIFRKKSDVFHISAQNINCRYPLEPHRRGGSNKCPQYMFLSRNKKHYVYPCKPQFYYIKVGFKWGQNYVGMFSCGILIQQTWNITHAIESLLLYSRGGRKIFRLFKLLSFHVQLPTHKRAKTTFYRP